MQDTWITWSKFNRHGRGYLVIIGSVSTAVRLAKHGHGLATGLLRLKQRRHCACERLCMSNPCLERRQANRSGGGFEGWGLFAFNYPQVLRQ